MAQQTRIAHVEPREAEQLADDDTAAQGERDHITVKDIDDLLDEIDACLEENVLEVVTRFIQKGGQAAAVFLDTVARGFRVITWRFPWAERCSI